MIILQLKASELINKNKVTLLVDTSPLAIWGLPAEGIGVKLCKFTFQRFRFCTLIKTDSGSSFKNIINNVDRGFL